MTPATQKAIREAYASFKSAEAGLCGLALRVVGAGAEFDRILGHVNQGLAALASLEAEQAAPPEQERECPHRKALAWIACPDCTNRIGFTGARNGECATCAETRAALQSPCVPLGEPGGRECCNFFRGPVPICDECREIMKSFAGITESDIERHQRFQEEVRKSAEELRRCVPLGEIEEAVAAEREECAKIAETLPTQRTEAAHRVIAAAIRARLQEKQG